MSNYLDLTGLQTYTTTLLEKINLAKNVTYDELVLARNQSKLKPGRWYAITDYVATTTQENTIAQSDNFIIIVEAINSNTLSENAYAKSPRLGKKFSGCDCSSWELKYSIFNDTNRFSWADDENGKGVIYYMKDEFGNEAPYDFKNIQFQRFLINNVTSKNSSIDTTELYSALHETYYRVNKHPFGSGQCTFYIDEADDANVYCYTFTKGFDGHYGKDGSISDAFYPHFYQNVIEPYYKNGVMTLPNNVVIMNEIVDLEDDTFDHNEIKGAGNTFRVTGNFGKVYNNIVKGNSNILIDTNNCIIDEDSYTNILISGGLNEDSCEFVTLNPHCSNNILINGTWITLDDMSSDNYMSLTCGNISIYGSTNTIKNSTKCRIYCGGANLSGLDNIWVGKNGNGVIKYTNLFDEFPTKSIAKMTSSDTSVQLNPDVFYNFPEMESLNITLAEFPQSTQLLEYQFAFDSGNVATTFTIPSYVQWTSTVTIGSNMHYQANIIYNPVRRLYYGTMVGWAITSNS